MNRRPWSAAEDELLCLLVDSPAWVVAVALGRSVAAVRARAARLGFGGWR